MERVVDLVSDPQFYALVNSANTTVANFYASWAEPCQHMNQVFAELSKKYANVTFVQVEAETFPDISEAQEIDSVPTFILFRGGKVLQRVEGANAPLLAAAVEKATKANSVQVPSQQLEQRLKSLINAQSVMIFIKGTPNAPRCGFSKQAIDLMNGLNVAYGSFDILSDDQVRQGLKEFSKWPTFPQFYVNGELIGGLDIVKEMVESGEFQQLLPETMDLDSRLQKLINQAPVMLFMKGNPSEPKCGFSNKLVALLQSKNIKFESFDILSDEHVRQGLKKYSSWPTYPQLYINGELIGGLDIVKEMMDSGEFQQMVPQ